MKREAENKADSSPQAGLFRSLLKKSFFRDQCGQVVHHEGYEEHEEKMICSSQDAKLERQCENLRDAGSSQSVGNRDA